MVFRYLYMLILAVDANFRLSHRFRAKERSDEELGPGWAYCVKSDDYQEYLRAYVSEKDVSLVSRSHISVY